MPWSTFRRSSWVTGTTRSFISRRFSAHECVMYVYKRAASSRGARQTHHLYTAQLNAKIGACRAALEGDTQFQEFKLEVPTGDLLHDLASDAAIDAFGDIILASYKVCARCQHPLSLTRHGKLVPQNAASTSRSDEDFIVELFGMFRNEQLFLIAQEQVNRAKSFPVPDIFESPSAAVTAALFDDPALKLLEHELARTRRLVNDDAARFKALKSKYAHIDRGNVLEFMHASAARMCFELDDALEILEELKPRQFDREGCALASLLVWQGSHDIVLTMLAACVRLCVAVCACRVYVRTAQ